MAGHARQQSYTLSQQRQYPESKSRTSSIPTSGTSKDPKSDANLPKPKLRTSCDGCQAAKLGCSQEKPTCRRCMRHGTICVYSPFRRIGRPRKSTNPRSNTSAKSRSQADNANEHLSTSTVEYLPDADIDGQSGTVTPLDILVAPPCSPASTDNGCGPWYPWSSDGTSLSTMNMDTSTNFIEGLDPYSSTTDYLDMDSCFDMHHDMLMNYTLPTTDEPKHNIPSSMQPTPPSSIDDEVSVFGETMAMSPTQTSADYHSNPTLRQQCTLEAPRTSSGESALNVETPYTALANLNSSQTKIPLTFPSEYINPTSRRAKEELSDDRIFRPNPDFSPPLSAHSSTSNPCNKRCSTSLIQQLTSLSKTLSDSFHPSLDVILQVERDTSCLCRRILACATCINEKSNHLLISMVVEQITRLFETISDERTSERCNLLVGNFQVDDASAKAEILKRLLLSRMSNFGGMLKEFSHLIIEDLTDCNTRAADEMLRDVQQRLDTLRSLIEHWERGHTA